MAREFTASSAVMKELAEDEKLVWMGAPEAFPLMNGDNKKGLTSRWLGCIVAAVAFIVIYILLNASMAGGINVWLLIILLIVVAYIAAMPVLDRNNIYKNCKYYVTDRRVILHHADKDIYALPLSGVKTAVVAAEPGCVHVELGACAGIKAKKRRTAAFVPKKSDSDNVIGMVLYNIEDNENVRKIFS